MHLDDLEALQNYGTTPYDVQGPECPDCGEPMEFCPEVPATIHPVDEADPGDDACWYCTVCGEDHPCEE